MASDWEVEMLHKSSLNLLRGDVASFTKVVNEISAAPEVTA